MLPICAAILTCAPGPAQETSGWILPIFFPFGVFILIFTLYLCFCQTLILAQNAEPLSEKES